MSDPLVNGVLGLTPADWDYVHEAVQELLAELARCVSERWPAISSRGGRTSTQRFPLFSYRTFQASTDASQDADAVVVGLDLQPQERGVSIRGDISGEETGHVFFEDGCEVEAEQDRDSVVKAALRVARRLAEQVDIIHEAVVSLSHIPGEDT